MIERTTPFLKLQDAKEVIVTVLEEKAIHEAIHWLGNKPYACTGEGCRYCHAQIPVRERDVIAVEVDGERYLLTLPASAFDRLISEFVVPRPLLGMVIGVTMVGSARNVHYSFRVASNPTVIDAAEGKESSFEGRLKMLIATLREVANDFETLFFTESQDAPDKKSD